MIMKLVCAVQLQKNQAVHEFQLKIHMRKNIPSGVLVPLVSVLITFIHTQL